MSDLEHRLGQLADEGEVRGASAVFEGAAADADRYRDQRRRRTGGLVAVVVVVALVAGGLVIARDHNGNAALPNGANVLSVVAATESTNSARFRTVAQTEQSGSPQTRSTRTTDGVVDFGKHVGSESRTTDQSRSVQENRWFGSRFYQHLDPETAVLEYGAPAGRTWILMDGAQMGTPGGCAGSVIDPLSAALGVSPRSSAPPSPIGLIESLRAAGATLAKIGVASVRDTPTTRWRVDTDAVTTTTAPARCGFGLGALLTTAPRIEIWTDAQDRLRRITFTTTTTLKNPGAGVLGPSGFLAPTPGKATSVETTTTELFDFGAEVHVEEPSPNEVYDVTAAVAAVVAGPGTVRPDGWADIAHGSFRASNWTIWFARTSTRWRCYELEGVSRPSQLPSSGIGDTMPRHDGRAAECAPSPGGVFENGPFTEILNGADGDRWGLVGRVSDAASDARLIFADGTSTTLPIDPETRLVRWSGPISPKPTKVEAGARTCSLDGSSDDQCQGAGLG